MRHVHNQSQQTTSNVFLQHIIQILALWSFSFASRSDFTATAILYNSHYNSNCEDTMLIDIPSTESLSGVGDNVSTLKTSNDFANEYQHIIGTNESFKETNTKSGANKLSLDPLEKVILLFESGKYEHVQCNSKDENEETTICEKLGHHKKTKHHYLTVKSLSWVALCTLVWIVTFQAFSHFQMALLVTFFFLFSGISYNAFISFVFAGVLCMMFGMFPSRLMIYDDFIIDEAFHYNHTEEKSFQFVLGHRTWIVRGYTNRFYR